MAKFVVCNATRDCLKLLLNHLSAEDIAECTLSMGPDFRERILGFAGITNLTALVDTESGDVLSIGGIEKAGYVSVVWMLTSEQMGLLTRADKRSVFGLMRNHLSEQLAIHGTLVNRVHVNTVSHIEFLTAMGAQFEQPDNEGWMAFALYQ